MRMENKDNSFQCTNRKNEKISLKISKDSDNHSWQINKYKRRNEKSKNKIFKQVPQKAPKKKPSLKVSVPISVWDAMQGKYSTEHKMATSNHTVVQRPVLYPPPSAPRARLPPPPPPPPPPLPQSPSGLRTFRHPVPTNKGRTSLADRFDQIVKAPKPIPPQTSTFQRTLIMPLMPGDVPPTSNEPAKDPEKNKTEDSNIAKPKMPVATIFRANLDSSLPIKHKLPLTVVPQKASYIQTTTLINKENRNISTQTTAEQLTQTEECLIITENEMHILEIVKNSGLTSQELENYLNKNNNEEDVIDVEKNFEDQVNEMYAKIMKQSANNKFVLKEVTRKYHQNNATTQPSTSPLEASPSILSTLTTEERSNLSTISAAAEALKSLLHPQIGFENNDVHKSLTVSALLMKMGFRLIQVEPSTQSTQTEEQSNNRKRKLPSTIDDTQTQTSSNELVVLYEENGHSTIQRPPVVSVRASQELPPLVPQMQEIPAAAAAVCQPAILPRQQQQPSQCTPEHIERQAQYYPHISGFMPPQRPQNTTTRSHHINTAAHHPGCEHNRNNGTFITQQTQVQRQTQAQLHPADPRRQGLNSQMTISGRPHLSRVLSTHEANMHGSQSQQAWTYQHYYDKQGTMYPHRHQ